MLLGRWLSTPDSPPCCCPLALFGLQKKNKKGGNTEAAAVSASSSSSSRSFFPPLLVAGIAWLAHSLIPQRGMNGVAGTDAREGDERERRGGGTEGGRDEALRLEERSD